MMVMICFYEALRHWGCFWLWCLLVFEWMGIECIYDVASGGGNFPLFGKSNRHIQRSIDIILYNRVNL
jgi:hypothetical protein